jgi:hypothetical protein
MYLCLLNIGNHEILSFHSGTDENSVLVECQLANRQWRFREDCCFHLHCLMYILEFHRP